MPGVVLFFDFFILPTRASTSERANGFSDFFLNANAIGLMKTGDNDKVEPARSED